MRYASYSRSNSIIFSTHQEGKKNKVDREKYDTLLTVKFIAHLWPRVHTPYITAKLMQTHFEWWVKSILTFVNKVKMLGFKVRNNLRNAFLSLTNDEHKNRKSLTLLSHSLFPFPIWIFAPKMGIFAIEDSDCKVYETFSYWVLDAMSKIICFFS